MKTLLLTFVMLLSVPSFADQQTQGPLCISKMFDEYNYPVAEKKWMQHVFVGMIEANGLGVKISTSLGNDQIMSLWIRDKRTPNPNGAFAFVDLSSGREQKNALYLANGYHVEVTCRWATY